MMLDDLMRELKSADRHEMLKITVGSFRKVTIKCGESSVLSIASAQIYEDLKKAIESELQGKDYLFENGTYCEVDEDTETYLRNLSRKLSDSKVLEFEV